MKKNNLKSFEYFVLRSKISPDLKGVVNDILLSCIEISELLSLACIEGLTGSSTKTNSSGESQKQLDLLSNQILRDQLCQNKSIKCLASEEEENAVSVFDHGNYAVAFDPLDGSTNIDINGTVGTIFSILPALPDKSPEFSFLQEGIKQVCAGYVIYGPATQLVITFGEGTYIFTLNPSTRTFLLTKERVSTPLESNEFAVNVSNASYWNQEFKNYISHLLEGKKGPRQKNYNMRWTGSMVSDIHRIISRGGIFMYPSDARKGMLSGKLRLIYEANPIGFILKNCGASAFNETNSILSITPKHLHQKVPVIAGSTKEVYVCLNYIQSEHQIDNFSSLETSLCGD